MFKEINYVKEIHTYKLEEEDWYMEVRKVHEVNEDNGLEWDSWMGYIYRSGYSPMFVIGESVKQCTLYSDWKEYEVSLEDFLSTMEFELYDNDCIVETPFEEYDRFIEAMEESNLEMINDLESEEE